MRSIACWVVWFLLLMIGLPAMATDYAWLSGELAEIEHVTLEARFEVPEGFQRVEVKAGSFGAFLRQLPIRRDRTHVLSYKGARLSSPSAAVVLIDVGDRDLQQCADALIRLHAEFLWATGKKEQIAYHFTSGDRSAWSDWQRGERFRVKGARVERVRVGAGANGHKAFRAYLDHVFMYAGTRSLGRDTVVVKLEDIQPGDLFNVAGSPGHAVMVLDVAVGPAGERVALIGQSYMPAQDFHVVKSSGERVVKGVWFLLPTAEHPTIKTPSWAAYGPGDLRRFR
ncbi:MAG: DUF4846 domain-containing protein [Bradymonadaceae bacterium]|nr:DUF4846 domain-containing protein [Lujinxingiaceae bacterium]